ncbi:HTH cro/C1-type domain-containing protein [Paenibacillus sediminis]|uniref:XRE family transcriptional regulator n=1 Tax=Paenibacillus sediminis TaxID=664909 RepID=A0ABS4H7H9_9BACL|nr:hypothetical protein [Paenibacillus sediminis]
MKKRSKFGSYLDRNGIEQERIREISKVSRDTLTRVCSNPGYYPSGTTMRRLIDAARKLTGDNVSQNDFWPM